MKQKRENSLSKDDVVMYVSRDTGLIQADVELIISSTIALIRDRVTEGVEVRLNEFGVFKTRMRPPKIARNLKGKGNKRKNPEPIHLPAAIVISYKPSKKFFTGQPVCHIPVNNQLTLL